MVTLPSSQAPRVVVTGSGIWMDLPDVGTRLLLSEGDALSLWISLNLILQGRECLPGNVARLAYASSYGDQVLVRFPACGLAMPMDTDGAHALRDGLHQLYGKQ